jgi:hypothetical protein
MNTGASRVIGSATYLGTAEQGARASGIGDVKAVLGEGAQNATGIVEEFEGLVTGVGNRRDDLQVPQSIDDGVGGRCLDGQAGGSRSGNCRGDEGDEGSAEVGGEHYDDGG